MQKESMLAIVGILVVSVVLLFAADYFGVPTGKAIEFQGPAASPSLSQPIPVQQPSSLPQPSAIAPPGGPPQWSTESIYLPGTDPINNGCNFGPSLKPGDDCSACSRIGITRRCVQGKYEQCGSEVLEPGNYKMVWYTPEGTACTQCENKVVNPNALRIKCPECREECNDAVRTGVCYFNGVKISELPVMDCSKAVSLWGWLSGCSGFCNPNSVPHSKYKIPACDVTC